MIVLANFLNAIAAVLGIILQTLIILITIRIILSWVNPDPYNPIVRFIMSATDPLIQMATPLRKYLSPRGSQVDFTLLAVILILIFLQYFLVPTIQDYALHLKY